MQGLDSSGSCLQQFHVQPFIGCGGSGSGTCKFDASGLSFWLTQQNELSPSQSAAQETVKGVVNIESKVSRCQVCLWTLPDQFEEIKLQV